MKVELLNPSLEPLFWRHVNQDPLDFYFFTFDWKLQRERSKIWMAIEDNKVDGMMLVYNDYIIQLRGNHDAVDALVPHAILDKTELQAPLDCEDVIRRKYVPSTQAELTLMALRKGEESPQIRHGTIRLTAEDSEEVAQLMRKCDPVWWGNVRAERLKTGLANAFVLGIRRNNRIVSIGITRLTDFGSNINVVATDEEHRNKGYATSIVSALVEEILKTSPTALIHVLSKNNPAVRTYSKVGFKPYRRYLFMQADRIN